MSGRMKEENTQKKYSSLTREVAILIIGLVMGTILLCWILNTVFLERFYLANKEKTLLQCFQVMDNSSSDMSSTEFGVTFDNLCANNNITILVISADQSIVRSSVNNTQSMLDEFMNIMFAEEQGDSSVMKQSDSYVVKRYTDNRLKSEYLVLYGSLSSGNLILIRTPLESIRESVQISNQFLTYVGLIGILFSVCCAVFVTQGITHPILQITNISKRMAELDFNAKYTGERRHVNEIDELGDHMNSLSETLERTISELKSANVKLMSDLEQKTQIDEMRKEFLSNVSHELKTPLALIGGYAEGLKECINDDPESRDFYCEVIIDETNKMNQMVQKLLTLNQLESGSDEVVMERFDIVELIRGVLGYNKILLEQKQIQVTFEEQEPIYVWADEFKIEQVLTNYLSNAIHYVDDRKQIQIGILQKENCVRVSVFNTGNLIPEEDINQIWVKFYKVDKARSREYGGSGIGLSIVKAIMESHHQQCGVINHSDGVEFWLELDSRN